MTAPQSGTPIPRAELEQFTERANRLLMSVKWTPRPDAFMKEKAAEGALVWRESTTSQPAQEEVLPLKLAHAVCKDPLILSDGVHHAVKAVRDGLRIGMHLSKAYTKFSGLDQLITVNSRGGLSEQQKAEFRGKYTTASAVTLFGAAYYVMWELGAALADKRGGVKRPLPALPEISLQDPVRALDCLIFYYAAIAERSGMVGSEDDFLLYTLSYFEKVVEEVRLRQSSLLYTEPFTGTTYLLEGSEFSIHGFEAEPPASESAIEFNRVSFSDIVGNRDAKHLARRLATRLLCYDFATERNPMVELGGLSPVTMGYGEPGTGKSLLIAATATLIADLCHGLKLPFLFWPMPDTVVSTFQGGSAERMMAWMKVLRDPKKIVYAPIDDAENNLEERSRQGVSAGVREVIAVFLRNTEGAYAIPRGNSLIQLFTNLPDQIDKAVLSRVNHRAYIGGATTYEDFIDQDYLWWRKLEKLDPKFVNLEKPRGYDLLSAQKQEAMLGSIYGSNPAPTDEKVRDVYEKVSREHSPTEHAFYGRFFAELKSMFPFFTSRDVRNIQRAIDSRLMDFDIPSEWFEKRELFCEQSYDRKKSMIVELMKATMKGLSFAEVRLQETVRYLETMVEIAETGKERRVKELLDDFDVRREAERRLGGR